jgi:hypothetical protein
VAGCQPAGDVLQHASGLSDAKLTETSVASCIVYMSVEKLLLSMQTQKRLQIMG